MPISPVSCVILIFNGIEVSYLELCSLLKIKTFTIFEYKLTQIIYDYH